MNKEEKLKKAKQAVENINKTYGDGTVITGDEKVAVESISTGSFGLDNAIGVGGLPVGRVTEIFGPEASGKTTIAIHVMAEAQKKGGIVAMVDAEHSFDTKYAEKLGVNVAELIFHQPDNGEQALQVADDLINSGGVDVVVIDSVAALVPKAELEGDMGDSKMGLQARLMGQAMRKLVASISNNGVVCIFINQLREKIGVMFGNPETTSGGNALKFYASVRLDIRRIATNKVDEESVSNRVRVKVVKNKVASPFHKAEFDIVFGEGIDRRGEVVDLGVELGLIKKGGAWFTYENHKIQGKESFKELLKDKPEIQKQLEDKLRKQIYG